jgi:hypothetical protein
MAANRPESPTLGDRIGEALPTGLVHGYAPDGEDIPLGGYAALASVFGTGLTAFAVYAKASGHSLPRSVPPWDVLLLGVATYKTARLLSKDKIASFVRAPFTRRKEAAGPSEVNDEPRGHGLRRSVGELVACPFCLSVWVSGALVCGYVAAPAATRTVAAGLSAVTVADWLQYAWTFTQEKAEG